MNPVRVLLVDDDEDDELIVRDLLRHGRRSYALTWAATYEDGVELLATEAHDIALVDYRLGARTGLELITAAVADRHPTPIVLLTGVDDELLDEVAATVGAADYLPKAGLDTALLERTIRYVLARTASLRQAQLSEQRFRTIVERASDALVIVDSDEGGGSEVTVWNPAATAVFGIAPADAEGRELGELLPLDASFDELSAGRTREVATQRRDGTPLVVEVSSSHWPAETGRQVCHIFRDVTQRVASREVLQRRASSDELTGLVNRATFVDRVDGALRSRVEPTVLYIDLDRFKAINDQHGHAAGDEVLRHVATRLREQLRADDVAARLGGDEFAVLLAGGATQSAVMGVAAIADRCLGALNEPYLVDGVWCHLSCSIGIATASQGDDAERLLHNADLAMYAAKYGGKARHHTYEPALRVAAALDIVVAERLRAPSLDEAVTMHYQPIVDLVTGTITGTEALLRWQQPGTPPVSPPAVVAIAERDGTMTRLGDWILERALRDARTWLDAGLVTAETFLVSVNLSARQLDDPALPARIRSLLAEHGVAAQMLCVELAETALVESAHLRLLEELTGDGVALAIDDFGVGYSSLHALVRYPTTIAKIDRTLLPAVGDERGVALLGGVLRLCGELGLQPIVEGVERDDQLALLQRLGRPAAQGYLLGMPMPCDALAERLGATPARLR